MLESGSERFDVRLESPPAQALRDERRQAPVLAPEVEGIGWRSDRHAVREHLLPVPRVEAAGVEADRKIGDDPRTGGRGGPQLFVGEPLHPAVEVDPLAVPVGIARHGR